MSRFDPHLSCVLQINVFSYIHPLLVVHVYLCSCLCIYIYMCVCVYVYMYNYICFRYFPASSTKEMLDEWRPLLCVFDVVMQKAVSNMELFLPTIMPPEEHSQGFQ